MSIHELDIADVVEKIKELKADIVGLQFPEGLKVHAIKVARQIELWNRCNSNNICRSMLWGL